MEVHSQDAALAPPSSPVDAAVVDAYVVSISQLCSPGSKANGGGGASVDGRWRLVFSTATKIRALQ